MGSDTRSGKGNKGYGSASEIGGERSDTTILVHVNADRSRAIAVSIPRDTLITLPKLDWATQKSAWVSSLQQSGIYLDIPLVERHQLANWIGQRLGAQGQSADKVSLDFMVQRVEGNLLTAHQEIRKIGRAHV